MNVENEKEFYRFKKRATTLLVRKSQRTQCEGIEILNGIDIKQF